MLVKMERRGKKNVLKKNLTCSSVSREAYPEVVVTDVQFAYNITDLVNLDKKRSA